MVENVNTTSMCCPRLIKREKPMENVKNLLVPPWVTFQSLKNLKWRVEKMMVRLHELRDLPFAWSNQLCH